MTGDTVDIDPTLLAPVKEWYTDEEGKIRSRPKDVGEMTEEEKQRYYFQQFWADYGEEISSLFGVGGKYETTNITFKLGYQPLGFWQKIFPGPTQNAYFGRTAWGKHGTAEHKLYDGARAIEPRFGIDQLSYFIYFSPDRARSRTAPHEWDHVQIIFDCVKRGIVVPSGLEQHELMRYGQIPKIQ